MLRLFLIEWMIATNLKETIYLQETFRLSFSGSFSILAALAVVVVYDTITIQNKNRRQTGVKILQRSIVMRRKIGRNKERIYLLMRISRKLTFFFKRGPSPHLHSQFVAWIERSNFILYALFPSRDVHAMPFTYLF